MSAINVPGQAVLRLVQSTILLRTGKKSTSTTTSSNQAASFRLTATKDMASCIRLERMGVLASKRRPAGPTGDATSTISGHRTSPRSHERRSIVSERFTTSSEASTANLLRSGLPHVRCRASPRLKHSATGLKEDPELLQAIVSNNDNLSYGSIISVYTGDDESVTALTDDGMDELEQMLKDARRSPQEWNDFLDSFVDNELLVARIKAKSTR